MPSFEPQDPDFEARVRRSFVATGRVAKAGRSVTVCTGEVEALRGGGRKTVALMQATVMTVQGRAGLAD